MILSGVTALPDYPTLHPSVQTLAYPVLVGCVAVLNT